MRYIALLRGINVGGKNKISMPQLKAAFEAQGFAGVSTYCSSVADRSYWQKPVMDIVERGRPLWVILENRRVSLRLWVTHEYGQLRITTAQLDLDCSSREYHESLRRYDCKNQADMAAKLKNFSTPLMSRMRPPKKGEVQMKVLSFGGGMHNEK